MSTRIVIYVEGGMVRGICTDGTDLDIVVWDRDNINAGDDPPGVDWAKACAEDKEPPEGFDWIY